MKDETWAQQGRPWTPASSVDRPGMHVMRKIAALSKRVRTGADGGNPKCFLARITMSRGERDSMEGDEKGRLRHWKKKKSHLLTRRLSHANKPYRAHHMTVTIQNAIVTATWQPQLSSKPMQGTRRNTIPRGYKEIQLFSLNKYDRPFACHSPEVLM